MVLLLSVALPLPRFRRMPPGRGGRRASPKVSLTNRIRELHNFVIKASQNCTSNDIGRVQCIINVLNVSMPPTKQ